MFRTLSTKEKKRTASQGVGSIPTAATGVQTKYDAVPSKKEEHAESDGATATLHKAKESKRSSTNWHDTSAQSATGNCGDKAYNKSNFEFLVKN